MLLREAGIISYHINLQTGVCSQLTELQHLPLIYCSLGSVLQPKQRQLQAAMCLYVILANHENSSLFTVLHYCVCSGWKNSGENVAILFRKFSAV